MTQTLLEKTCIPCRGGIPPLTREVAESFLNFSLVARREAEQQGDLTGAPDVLVTVPFFDWVFGTIHRRA